MWQGEYFWSPPEIIEVVFAYTFFCTIEKVVLYRQLTKPKVISLTRPALLKHFKGTANHAGHIWSQQALVPSISVPSLQDWGWISLRGEWRLSCTPLSEITKLRVELVKYARKKGYAQKSDNRERQSQTLFSITSSRLHEVSSHKVTEISSVGSSLVMMFRIHNENSELSVYVVVQIFSLVWIFLNWFKFFKLVWNFQTGLKFLNTCLIVIYLYLCM